MVYGNLFELPFSFRTTSWNSVRSMQLERKLNNGYLYKDIVTSKGLKKCSKSDGVTLLDYYTYNYPHSSRDTWCTKIKQGLVSVGARIAFTFGRTICKQATRDYTDDQIETSPERTIEIGQKLSYFRPPWVEPPVPALPHGKIEVLYSDNDVAVVNKPRGWPVLPGGLYYENTLLHVLRNQEGLGELNSVAHRLGRGTSGALLLAKSEVAKKQLSLAFSNRTMYKEYLAVLAGIVEKNEFTITAPIGKVRYLHCKATQSLWAATETGKPSVSHFRVMKRVPEKQLTVCSVVIETGRPHQIRIHSAYAGHPLVGDPLYTIGGVPVQNSLNLIDDEDIDASVLDSITDDDSKPRDAPLPGDCGYMLHSWKIEFPHPLNGQLIRVEAPPPSDIQQLLT